MSIRHAGEVAFIQHQFSTHSIEFYRPALLGKIIGRHSPLILARFRAFRRAMSGIAFPAPGQTLLF
jgi:hypothetical protein